MCIGYTPHWSTPFLGAVPFALIVAAIAFFVSLRFVDRRRAGWIAFGIGILAWVFFSVILIMFTGTLQRC